MQRDKKIVFKVGDKVKIVLPEFFIRCGYPLTKEVAIKQFTQEQKDAINNCLLKFNVSPRGIDAIMYGVYDKIADLFAYEVLKQKKFGGNERKIFTISKPELKDKEYNIVSKKVVKTGIYCPGRGVYEDYDPPFLRDEKSHVILGLDLYCDSDILSDFDYCSWIEAKNVELVKCQ